MRIANVSGFCRSIISLGSKLSEGGFDANAVATANILETSTKEMDGKQYYYLSVLTRTADGDEGGKHQLITATVNGGKLYICKAQAGDKRWFKGARKFVENAATSFNALFFFFFIVPCNKRNGPRKQNKHLKTMKMFYLIGL